MDRLGCAWRVIWQAVDGLKTLVIAGVFVVLGLADYFDAVPLKPVFDYLFGEDAAAKLMIYLPIVFASLRFATNGAPKWSKRWREEQKDRFVVDDPVDQPQTVDEGPTIPVPPKVEN